jgi:hypothetical protein
MILRAKTNKVLLMAAVVTIAATDKFSVTVDCKGLDSDKLSQYRMTFSIDEIMRMAEAAGYAMIDRRRASAR